MVRSRTVSGRAKLEPSDKGLPEAERLGVRVGEEEDAGASDGLVQPVGGAEREQRLGRRRRHAKPLGERRPPSL